MSANSTTTPQNEPRQSSSTTLADGEVLISAALKRNGTDDGIDDDDSDFSPKAVADTIANLLSPTPPFYSSLSSTKLVAALADASFMNCDRARARMTIQATGNKSNAPSWSGVGTVFSALDDHGPTKELSEFAYSLQSSTTGDFKTSATTSKKQGGLWSQICLSIDLEDGQVTVAPSYVVPADKLRQQHFYAGNVDALTQLGVGKEEYPIDDWAAELHAYHASSKAQESSWSPISSVTTLGSTVVRLPFTLCAGMAALVLPAGSSSVTTSKVEATGQVVTSQGFWSSKPKPTTRSAKDHYRPVGSRLPSAPTKTVDASAEDDEDDEDDEDGEDVGEPDGDDKADPADPPADDDDEDQDDEGEDTPAVPSDPSGQDDEVPVDAPSAPPGDVKDPDELTRVWVPSTTKLSIDAHWWGYTIYLPKPVMDKLGDGTKSAQDIARTINDNLQLIFAAASRLSAILPPQLAAILAILKAIAPITSAISSFIGWTWSSLKEYDKGQGICLSATWILPIALVPRSFDAPTSPEEQAAGVLGMAVGEVESLAVVVPVEASQDEELTTLVIAATKDGLLDSPATTASSPIDQSLVVANEVNWTDVVKGVADPPLLAFPVIAVSEQMDKVNGRGREQAFRGHVRKFSLGRGLGQKVREMTKEVSAKAIRSRGQSEK